MQIDYHYYFLLIRVFHISVSWWFFTGVWVTASFIIIIIIIIIIIVDRLIGLVGRVFTIGPGDLGSIPGRVIPKTLKMVLDTSLLNTQQYKVCIKGKVEQSRERSSAPSYTSVWKLLKREPSGRPQLRSPTLLIIIIIIMLFWEFFTAALADGFSLEFKWQQVSLSLQDSSQYLGWS